MQRTLIVAALLIVAIAFQPGVFAQDKAGTAPAYKPTEQEWEQMRSKSKSLSDAVAGLHKAGVNDDLIADAEVAWHAAQMPQLFPEEFIDQMRVRKVLSVLDGGLQRAKAIADGKPNWTTAKGTVTRGYRSKVDGTAQPYRLMIPTSYNPSTPMPLLIYLHGRGDKDFDTNWVGSNGGGGGNGNYIKLLCFGRFNCSYRWAGESDVLEALESVKKRYNIDNSRIVLTGFSMGGAGSWYHGLHYPDLWAGLEVDAGVIGKRASMDGLTSVQKAINAPYGVSVGHALNLYNLPIVAYAGEKDAQLAASTSIREQLVKEGFEIEQTGTYERKAKDLKALFLITPGAGHSHASGETAKKVNAFVADEIQKGRTVPDHIKFVTFTTRYNKSDWITIDGLKQHFERADIDAVRDPEKHTVKVTTKNVSHLQISDIPAWDNALLTIDGTEFKINGKTSGGPFRYTWKDGQWTPGTDDALRKKHGLQGPIDDAFLDSFLCVTPNEGAWNAITDSYAKSELTHFTKSFGKNYRGDVRTKSARDINDADIKSHNLVLFGDPGSNKVLAKIMDKLPIQWTKENITVAGKTYAAGQHVPVLIYPNPLNPERYVVINTGMTAEGQGGMPRLGDYAVLRVDAADTSQVVENGIFDEKWQFAKGR